MVQLADKPVPDAILVKTHVANSAITGNTFVKLVTSTGTPSKCDPAGAGDAAIGVARDGQSAGRLVDVIVMGQAHVTAGENIAAGAIVAAGAAGVAMNAVSTNHVLGRAMTDANSGEYVRVQLYYGGIKA